MSSSERVDGLIVIAGRDQVATSMGEFLEH
jgi:hypothetical protein